MSRFDDAAMGKVVEAFRSLGDAEASRLRRNHGDLFLALTVLDFVDQSRPPAPVVDVLGAL